MQFHLMNLWYGERAESVDFEALVAAVPKGWESILHKGFEEMFALGWDGEVRQIKEKFGSLRLYIQNDSEELSKVIYRMAKETQNVCSVCGNPRTKTSSGWVLHYCDEHFPEQK